MILQAITKAHCVIVCFKFEDMFFCLCEVFFVPGNYTKILSTKDGKPDLPVCKIASKSFPVQKSAFSDETDWLKKLNIWSSLFELQNCKTFSTFNSQLLLNE